MKIFCLIGFTIISLSLLLLNPVKIYAQYCGDGACNGAEVCSSCGVDCGSCYDPPIYPIGVHEGVVNSTCETTGWALDKNVPSSEINVKVWRDQTGINTGGTYIGEYTTNIPRPDINAAQGVSGYHGFDIRFIYASGLKDGQNHTIWVYAQDTQNNGNYYLTSTPRTINCPVPPVSSCSSAGPDDVVMTSNTTSHTLNAYGVANAGRVIFGVWTEANGQDDLAWYEGINQGGGTWSITINPSAHPGSGVVYAYVYTVNEAQAVYWCDTANFYKNDPPYTQNLVINTPSVSANKTNQYVITATSVDGNGGADINDQYAWINYTTNARGIVAWSNSNFYPLGNAMKPGSVINCTDGNTGQLDGSKGGIYNAWGETFIYLDACSSRVSGNQRITTYTVRFDPSFQDPTTNTLYSYVHDGYLLSGWNPYGQFNLDNPYPVELGAAISPKPITADNTTQYVITIRSSDNSGVADILNQYAGINLTAVQWRGLLNYSKTSFGYWNGTGALKAGSLKTCTNVSTGAADGQAGIYADNTTYGANFINLDSCTTQAETSTIRRTTFTVRFPTLWLTNNPIGPITNNRVWGLSYDSLGHYDTLGWYPGDFFDIALPNMYVTPGSIVLRYAFGATPNCSNGIIVPNGGGVPNGTQLELCTTFGNNGTGATGSSFKADTYVNQATQPAGNVAGTAGNYVIGPYPVGGPWPGQQFGVFSADSSKCTTNCRAALFFDRDNTIAESNETDNFATSVAYNVVAARKLSGNIYIDSGFDSCQVGTRTPYPNSSTASVKVDSGSSTLGTGSVSNNFYQIFVAPGSPYSATLYNLPSNKNYTVRYVSYAGGPWTNPNGFTVTPMDLSATDKTLDWCLNDTKPWIKVGDGDTRYPKLNDPVPSTLNPSIGNNPFSAFFSSNLTTSSFGAGTTASFFINDEYSYNNDPITKQGLFSYTFFRNRAKIKGVATASVPGCNSSTDCIITAGTAFPANTINTPYLVNGDLTINGYTQQPGTHVLLLVNGNVNINSNIKVPAGAGNPSGPGSLFVLAAGSDTKDPAKGNIYVSPAVGTTPSTDPNTSCPTNNPIHSGDYSCANLEGVYSAEKSIVLQSNANCPSTPDKQITFAGNIITNALKPFATTGTGKFVNNRTLCPAGDALYPVFVMQSRYDFVPQLTDFYKVPSVRWKEINP